MSDHTFENNGRQIQEELIDPGPIPGLTPLRAQQKELRRALSRPESVPMRRDMHG